MISIIKFARLSTVTLLTILTLATSLVMMPTVAGAATQAQCNDDKAALVLGIPKWYKYLDYRPDTVDAVEGDGATDGRCNIQIDTVGGVLPIGLALLEAAIRLAGLVAVVMIFVSSVKFITSQGNGDSAKEARMTAINALIGLVIVIIATSVISFVGTNLGVN